MSEATITTTAPAVPAPGRERSSWVALIRAADQPILAGIILAAYVACALLKIETSAPFDSLAFLAASYFFKTADKSGDKPNKP